MSEPTLKVDLLGHRVWVGLDEINLTPAEYTLIAALAQHPTEARSREKLLDALGWRGSGFHTRTVDAHLYRVRQKIGTDFIVSVPGFGYRLAGNIVVRRQHEEHQGVVCPSCGAALESVLRLEPAPLTA